MLIRLSRLNTPRRGPFPGCPKKSSSWYQLCSRHWAIAYLRWPTLPSICQCCLQTLLGLPHTATQFGYIKRYFIPTCSLIIANLWLFFPLTGINCNLPIQEHASRSRDLSESIYLPERHLGEKPQRDPQKVSSALVVGSAPCGSFGVLLHRSFTHSRKGSR